MSHILAQIISELFEWSIMKGIYTIFVKKGMFYRFPNLEKKDQTTNYRLIDTLPVLTNFFKEISTQDKDLLLKFI